MLTIEIVNDQTGPDTAANYRWTVWVNHRRIDHGTVTGHRRGQRWTALVRKILQEADRGK